MKNKSIKKIAILYSGGKNFGGIESYLVNLFNSIDKKHFEIELLSLGEWALTDKLKEAGYKVKVFSGRRFNPKSIDVIGKYVTKHGFGLLVSQGTVANAYGRAISLLYKIPNLVTVHSTQDGDYKNKFIRSIYKLIEKVTRFPTVKYIAVSKYLKHQLVNGGLRDGKIKVIYNGLDYPKSKARPHKRLIIGSLGRLHPVKGYDLLISAFAAMPNKRLRLRIAGTGDELENLKNLADQLGVGGRVEFVGFKTDVYEFLDGVDVYVQSSLSEGFGLAVVQAMSQSIPVVVTPAGSLVELVNDNKTGYIANDFKIKSIAEAMTRAVSNYEGSKKIGENAKDFVLENFETKKWIKETEKIYDEVCL